MHDFKYIMPITGITHHIDDWQTFVEKIEKGTLITFRWDEKNQYSRVAFTAFLDEKPIGTLSRDYADEALFLAGQKMYFHAVVAFGHWKTIYVEVNDPQGELLRIGLNESYQPLITTTALSNLSPLPYLPEEDKLQLASIALCNKIDEYIQQSRYLDQELAARLDAWLEKYRQCSHITLCREDNYMYKRLHLQLTAEPLYPNDHTLQQWLKDFTKRVAEIHNHLVQGSKTLDIMNHQLELLRENVCQPQAMLDHYRRIYCYGLTREELEQEAQRIEKWLRRDLPWGIYALNYDHPDRLAKNIFYLRLSRAEIYKVYQHILVLEYLHGKLTIQDQTDTTIRPAVVRNVKAHVEQTNVLFKMLLKLMNANLVLADWDKARIQTLLEELLIAPTEDATLQTLRDNFWADVQHMRGGIIIMDVKINRFLEILGFLHQRGILVGQRTAIANTLKTAFNLPASHLNNIKKILNTAATNASPTTPIETQTLVTKLMSRKLEP